jgi:predicted RNase H-like nuclease (RuvC/YqgF family)
MAHGAEPDAPNGQQDAQDGDRSHTEGPSYEELARENAALKARILQLTAENDLLKKGLRGLALNAHEELRLERRVEQEEKALALAQKATEEGKLKAPAPPRVPHGEWDARFALERVRNRIPNHPEVQRAHQECRRELEQVYDLLSKLNEKFDKLSRRYVSLVDRLRTLEESER